MQRCLHVLERGHEMRINENFNRSLAYLAKVLPPIKYSKDEENVSLTEEIGEVLYTEGVESDITEGFKDFLHIRGALLPFISNTLSRGGSTAPPTPSTNINGAFSWSYPLQGRVYWENLHDAWQHAYKAHTR